MVKTLDLELILVADPRELSSKENVHCQNNAIFLLEKNGNIFPDF